MPIPDFDGITNVIPPCTADPGLGTHVMTPYRCTLLELVQKYATSPERISILKGYCDFRTALISNGITGFQWADGSFVENVESQRGRPPGDIGVVTFVI